MKGASICVLCALRPGVTLVQIANGSPVPVCLECATGNRTENSSWEGVNLKSSLHTESRVEAGSKPTRADLDSIQSAIILRPPPFVPTAQPLIGGHTPVDPNRSSEGTKPGGTARIATSSKVAGRKRIKPKRICIECRRIQTRGKDKLCTSCRDRHQKQLAEGVPKLNGQGLSQPAFKKQKANPCFTGRQFRGGIVQGGLPSLGKRK